MRSSSPRLPALFVPALVASAFLGGCGHSASLPASAAPASPAPAAAPTAPDLDALLAMLAPHARTAFDQDAVARGCPEGEAIGTYVAMLVSRGRGEDAAPGDRYSLDGGCSETLPDDARTAFDPPPDPSFFECRIDARTVDDAGESPWHYELRVRVSRDDLALDLATLRCPGV